MWRDSAMRWDVPFPYDALAPVGITPASTMREVKDATFDLMRLGLLSPDVRVAWDELRLTPRRLFVDFFLYDVDLEHEAACATAALEAEIAGWAEAPDLSDALAIDDG